VHTLTYEGLCTSVSADVYLEMCFLVETLVAIWHVALVPFPWLLSDLWLFRLHVD